jgi:hypothetical protein
MTQKRVKAIDLLAMDIEDAMLEMSNYGHTKYAGDLFESGPTKSGRHPYTEAYAEGVDMLNYLDFAIDLCQDEESIHHAVQIKDKALDFMASLKETILRGPDSTDQ